MRRDAAHCSAHQAMGGRWIESSRMPYCNGRGSEERIAGKCSVANMATGISAAGTFAWHGDPQLVMQSCPCAAAACIPLPMEPGMQ